MYNKVIKRILDILLSSLALLVLAIPMLIVAIIIKIDSPGPVFFKQKRVGIHKTYFNILKFRTMRTETPHDAPTHQLSNPQKWITKVGAVLRKTSIDELPQILNILVGQMSIVGPRPALWNQYDLIEQRDALGVNDARPGLTGWAQINGRDELAIEEKVKLDYEYTSKISFWFDAKCILMSVLTVVRHDGVIEGQAGEPGRSRDEADDSTEAEPKQK